LATIGGYYQEWNNLGARSMVAGLGWCRLVTNRKWLRNHPRILFLIQNLFYCTALQWHGLNKTVCLSLKCRSPGSVMDMFQVCHANVCGFASHLGALTFS